MTDSGIIIVRQAREADPAAPPQKTVWNVLRAAETALQSSRESVAALLTEAEAMLPGLAENDQRGVRLKIATLRSSLNRPLVIL